MNYKNKTMPKSEKKRTVIQVSEVLYKLLYGIKYIANVIFYNLRSFLLLISFVLTIGVPIALHWIQPNQSLIYIYIKHEYNPKEINDARSRYLRKAISHYLSKSEHYEFSIGDLTQLSDSAVVRFDVDSTNQINNIQIVYENEEKVASDIVQALHKLNESKAPLLKEHQHSAMHYYINFHNKGDKQNSRWLAHYR